MKKVKTIECHGRYYSHLCHYSYCKFVVTYDNGETEERSISVTWEETEEDALKRLKEILNK